MELQIGQHLHGIQLGAQIIILRLGLPRGVQAMEQLIGRQHGLQRGQPEIIHRPGHPHGQQITTLQLGIQLEVPHQELLQPLDPGHRLVHLHLPHNPMSHLYSNAL